MKLKPFIGRIGGKAKIAKFIVNQFKDFDYSIYCEPFCSKGLTSINNETKREKRMELLLIKKNTHSE